MSKWEMVKLGEHVSIRTGKLDANASSENGKYPFFTCSKAPLRIDTYSYDCECVLVAGNGDLNVKYYDGKFDAYQRTYIIESEDKLMLDVRYLYKFLDNYLEILRQQSIGGVIKYIKLGNLTEVVFPLPPLEEQKKIANELDQITDLIAKRKLQLEKLDLLVKAKFVEMFGDIGSNQKFDCVALKDITKVLSGGTPSREIAGFWNGDIPWVKTTELKDREIYDTDEKITRDGLNGSSAKICSKNTILIAMYGQGKTRGKTAILRIEASTNQACACILPSETFNSDYLWRYLILCYEDLRGLAKGGNQPNLSGQMIREYRVLLPPLDLQNQFAQYVETVERTKAKMEQGLQQLELLYAERMQGYFE